MKDTGSQATPRINTTGRTRSYLAQPLVANPSCATAHNQQPVKDYVRQCASPDDGLVHNSLQNTKTQQATAFEESRFTTMAIPRYDNNQEINTTASPLALGEEWTYSCYHLP
eukprot:887019-Amphidinium_carterae.1